MTLELEWAEVQTSDETTQAYQNPARFHERIFAACQQAGIKPLSTPFDVDSLAMLRGLGLTTFKIASSESGNPWWMSYIHEQWFVSWPWGMKAPWFPHRATNLTAIPLYPTPLEAVGRATMLDGWSDHTIGITACQWALAKGATVIEAHLKLDGRGRNSVWDKTPEDFAALRAFADKIETIQSGVSTQFRERWRA